MSDRGYKCGPKALPIMKVNTNLLSVLALLETHERILKLLKSDMEEIKTFISNEQKLKNEKAKETISQGWFY